MKRLIYIFVLGIAINCGFAQNRYLDNRYLEIRLKNNPANEISSKIKNFHNQQLTANNKILKSGKSTKWQCDTIIAYDTLTKDTLGLLYGRVTQTFDVSGNVLINKTEAWYDNTWINFLREIYTYDANGNVLTVVYEESPDNAWVNYLKVIYSYYANGNVLSYTEQQWESNAWVNSSKYTFTYNTNGKELTYVNTQWQGSAWINTTKDTVTYDATGNIRLDLVIQQWQSNSWVNSSRDTLSYDLKQNVISDLYEDWHNNAWVNDSIYSYTYDANGNITTNLFQLWKSSYWVNNTMDTLTYDANGNMLSDIQKAWNNLAWVNSAKYNYTYDVNGNSISGKYEVWNKTKWVQGMTPLQVYSQKNSLVENGIIVSIYRYTAHWVSFTSGIKQLTMNDEQLTVYPNPTNSLLDVSYQLSGNSCVNISIYDITGREVSNIVKENEGMGNYIVKIKTQQMTEGIYILKFNAGNYTESKKIVIQH